MTPEEFYAAYPIPGLPRERAIVREILSGNTPSWAFKLKEILPGVKVTMDYLALGSDQNFCRCPMTPFAAQAIGNALNYKFPTQKLVDLIWKYANKKLPPKPQDWYKHEQDMRSGKNYLKFNQIVNYTPTLDLVAGHKKDVVSSVQRFKTTPRHVAIYGWHQLNGKPIQPPTLIHDWNYEDYSHGIRLVKCDDPEFAGPCSIDQSPL